MRAGKKRFALLTVEEKNIPSRYIKGETRTQNLSVQSGIVQGLVDAGIIYRSNDVSSVGTACDYNILDWAWDYLNEHRELLSVAEAAGK